MQVTVETITPKIASAYLDQNVANRKVKKVNLEALTRDIKNGAFQANGDAIRFSLSGKLLDGQHRLMACVAAGKPIQTVVIRDLPDETQNTMDCGVVRQAGDKLSLAGIKNGNTVAAAIKAFYGYKTQQYSHVKVTHAEVFDFIENNPTIEEWASECHSSFPGLGSILTAVSFIISKKYGGSVALDFVNVFKTGIPSMENCAAHAVREKLVKMSGSALRLSPNARLKLVMWGAMNFAERRPISVVRIPEKINISWIKDVG